MSEINNIPSSRLAFNSPSQIAPSRFDNGSNPSLQDIRTGRVQTDRVELSDHSRLLSQLRSQSIRNNIVQDVKAQISTGNYLTDARIDGSLDELAIDLDITAQAI